MNTARVGSLPKKKKEGQGGGEKRQCKKKKKSNVDKPMCNCTWAFLSKNNVQFFPSIFSLLWRENFLVRPGRKHLSSIVYFSSSPSNQTHSKKFSFLFSLQIFHPPYFTSKQTHTLSLSLSLSWHSTTTPVGHRQG